MKSYSYICSFGYKHKRELASSKRTNNAGCHWWLDNVWLAKSPASLAITRWTTAFVSLCMSVCISFVALFSLFVKQACKSTKYRVGHFSKMYWLMHAYIYKFCFCMFENLTMPCMNALSSQNVLDFLTLYNCWYVHWSVSLCVHGNEI